MNDINSLRAMVASLEAQLVELYRERQEAPSVAQLQAAIASLEAQLVDLYAERAELPIPIHHTRDAIASLEEQCVSLVDEKAALEASVHELRAQIERFKRKSKAMGAAIMEAALFDSEPEMKKGA